MISERSFPSFERVLTFELHFEVSLRKIMHRIVLDVVKAKNYPPEENPSAFNGF